MVNSPQTYYRSESCRELDERINRGAGYDSLNVTVNVDQILTKRHDDVAIKVHQAITENRNFVLFAGEKNYIIIIPCKLAVACYSGGVQQTMELMKDMQQFQNRVKIAYAVYDKFHELDRLVEGGRNGNDTLSLYTAGEDL